MPQTKVKLKKKATMTKTLKYSTAHYTTSAPSINQCPPDAGSEVAFAGRSNAGKSSALNALTGNRKLARTSKTPGRTQLINFFELSEQQRLVDLPGYGFAKVPKAMKQKWDRHLAEYLQKRTSLKGLILLSDIRQALQPYDWQMLSWAKQAAMPVHILLTKADKMNRGPAQNIMLKIRNELDKEGFGDAVSIQTFSATKKEGIKPLETVLNAWLEI
jgi:GTP-binding protein